MHHTPLRDYVRRFALGSPEVAIRHARESGLSLCIHTSMGAVEHVDFAQALESDPAILFVHEPCEAVITLQSLANLDHPTWRACLRLASETIELGNVYLSADSAEFAATLAAARLGYCVIGATYSSHARVLELSAGKAGEPANEEHVPRAIVRSPRRAARVRARR
jgi:hypothetical protein